MTVPNYYGFNRVEREKITKYQELKNDFKNDLSTTWSLQEMDIVIVVVRVKGIIKKNFKEYLKTVSEKSNFQELQPTTIKETIAILKRSLGFNKNNL